MNLEEHKRLLNQELDRFNALLSEILPRYVLLMKKRDCTPEEEKELGNIEHLLIEINGKIAEIKNKLDHDLFGETMNIYYQAKEDAKKGNLEAKIKLDKLRKRLMESVQGDVFFNWN